MEAPQKYKNGATTQGAIQQPLFWISIKNFEKIYCKDICTPMFTAGLVRVAKTGRQPKHPSTGDWIKKKWHIYTVDILLSHEKR